MKRVIILAFLLVAAVTFSQAYIYTANPILSWEVVTQFEDGTPFEVGDAVQYEVGRSVDPVTNRVTPEQVIGITNGLSMAVVVPDDMTWYVYAVRSVVTTDGGSTVLYSTWNWSDENGAATPDPFWYRHPTTTPPSIPLGFAGN